MSVPHHRFPDHGLTGAFAAGAIRSARLLTLRDGVSVRPKSGGEPMAISETSHEFGGVSESVS